MSLIKPPSSLGVPSTPLFPTTALLCKAEDRFLRNQDFEKRIQVVDEALALHKHTLHTYAAHTLRSTPLAHRATNGTDHSYYDPLVIDMNRLDHASDENYLIHILRCPTFSHPHFPFLAVAPHYDNQTMTTFYAAWSQRTFVRNDGTAYLVEPSLPIQAVHLISAINAEIVHRYGRGRRTHASFGLVADFPRPLQNDAELDHYASTLGSLHATRQDIALAKRQLLIMFIREYTWMVAIRTRLARCYPSEEAHIQSSIVLRALSHRGFDAFDTTAFPTKHLIDALIMDFRSWSAEGTVGVVLSSTTPEWIVELALVCGWKLWGLPPYYEDTLGIDHTGRHPTPSLPLGSFRRSIHTPSCDATSSAPYEAVRSQLTPWSAKSLPDLARESLAHPSAPHVHQTVPICSSLAITEPGRVLHRDYISPRAATRQYPLTLHGYQPDPRRQPRTDARNAESLTQILRPYPPRRAFCHSSRYI